MNKLGIIALMHKTYIWINLKLSILDVKTFRKV